MLLKNKGSDLTEFHRTIKNEIQAGNTCLNSDRKMESQRECSSQPLLRTALVANRKHNPILDQKHNLLKVSFAFCNENLYFDKCSKLTDITACRRYSSGSGHCFMCLRSEYKNS